MTDREKLEKIKKLADAMYYAAQQLTTDASRLHKAMDEYHKFIIHECKEEPVSEDLEEAAEEWDESLYRSDAFKAGAKWQKVKDQETIETAIHHAYHNGKLEMKEQLLAKAVDGEVTYGKSLAIPSLGYRLDKEGLDFGDKVKVIIIKED